eukprot:751072-Hanusia_phi.AAC.2
MPSSPSQGIPRRKVLPLSARTFTDQHTAHRERVPEAVEPDAPALRTDRRHACHRKHNLALCFT